ncbi:hypothetical protein FGSG_12197 [Fusarium graminearum PH-1]|uniref:hypothetical protein n=1 Tax=Gibberella zeae (strain ATCC MYA-4620 / CBS 123657 / FGSC 9075 / NRRL 31084 / PH-1) TaxID=229533 RepID=UPI00021F1700|nr:hypothetical protein FGSG_12197 [Fusarium graminearum PH-1]ESU08227.1 hypothetical protein FGSG_12197 [Fusarium graminearum PH-1]|eukprot:XP_011318712.1 hypothetical protein FGSG_12197 [Fusarium graminearum PH-1]
MRLEALEDAIVKAGIKCGRVEDAIAGHGIEGREPEPAQVRAAVEGAAVDAWPLCAIGRVRGEGWHRSERQHQGWHWCWCWQRPGRSVVELEPSGMYIVCECEGSMNIVKP